MEELDRRRFMAGAVGLAGATIPAAGTATSASEVMRERTHPYMTELEWQNDICELEWAVMMQRSREAKLRRESGGG